ncbi:MAG: ABC transporter permease subunit [Rubrobacter sp.]|nr:ABC transporter permease subunit [Rubrobacter sp.]
MRQVAARPCLPFGPGPFAVRRAVRPAVFSTFVMLFAFVSLLPVAWVFKTNAVGRIVSPGELFVPPTEVFAPGFSLLPYVSLLHDLDFLRPLANGVITAVTTAVVCFLIGSMAAYAIARNGFRPGKTSLTLVLAMGLLPPLAAVAPPLVRSAVLEVSHSRLAMLVPDLVVALPLAIWFLVAYFRELPAELGEAARGDGTQTGTFWRVMLPVATPGVLTTAVLTFVFAWNQYLFAGNPALEERLRPVAAVLPEMPNDLLPALSVVVTLPLVALVLGYQRLVVVGSPPAVDGRTSPRTGNRAKVHARRVAPGVATAILLLAQSWALLLFLRHGWDALAFSFPLNYGEGPLLDQAVRLADFKNIYPGDLGEAPYTISNYPPFYLLVQAPFVWLFGPEFWYGRLISLASVAATALFVALTLYTLTRDRIAALAAGLTFPAIPYVLRWSSLGRVDLLGLALSWAGLFAVVRWPERRRTMVVAALLFVAAVSTRQTYVLAAPLTAFVWLLVQGRRRRALELAGISCGLGLVSFLALNVATDGGFFLNTVIANTNDFRWERVSFNALGALLACPLLLLGGLAFLWKAPRDRVWWLVGPYLALTVPSALLVGKVGSDVNYLLELSAALCLATGALIAWQRERPRLRALLIALLAVQVLALAQSSLVPSGLQDYVVDEERDVRQLSKIVAAADGPVLTDEYMGLLPLNGKHIQFQPFEMTQLSRDGAWNQDRAVESIRKEKYSVIMMWEPPFAKDIKQDRWTDEMLAAVEANYEPEERLADMVVYRPK